MAIFREVNNWTYMLFEPGTPVSVFGAFSPFVDLWHAKRGENHMPAWRDYELEDFAPWYGWVSVADIVNYDEVDLRVRLWGTKMTDLFGYDLTGKNYSDPSSGYDSNDADFIAALIKTKGLGYTTGSIFWQQRDHILITIIRLPLANDGTTIDKLLNLSMNSPE